MGTAVKAYLYCSYTGSPVGFVMGVSEMLVDGNWSPMSLNGISKDIRGCFEHAIIRNAAGNFVLNKPDGETDNRWILLIKNLTYKLPETEDNFTYYINIALETTDYKEYEIWTGQADVDKLGERVASCLDITKSSDFGYVIKEDNLSSLVDSSLGAIPREIATISLKNCCLEFVPRLPNVERSNFIQTFVPTLLPCDLEDIHANPGWCFVKKKILNRQIKYGVVAGIALLIIAGIWIMMPGEKKKPATPSDSSIISSTETQEEQIRKKLRKIVNSQTPHLKTLDTSVFFNGSNDRLSALLLLDKNQLEAEINDYLNNNGKIKIIKQADPVLNYDENIKDFKENILYSELLLLDLNQRLPIFIISDKNNIFKDNQLELFDIRCKIEKND